LWRNACPTCLTWSRVVSLLSVIHHYTIIIHHCTTIIHHCSTIMHHCTTIIHHCMTVIHHCTTIIQCCMTIIHHCTTIIQCCMTIIHHCTIMGHSLYNAKAVIIACAINKADLKSHLCRYRTMLLYISFSHDIDSWSNPKSCKIQCT